VKPYVIALLLVVGILGGFYGGYKLGHNGVTASASTGSTNTGSRTGGGGFGGFGGGTRGAGGGAAACPSPGAPSPSPGGNAVARGTVTDLTGSSLTITLPACDVKITFGPTVQVSKTTAGSTSDLKDNITITVIGVRQADGSIKATTIQIGGAVFGNPGAQASPGGG
jgi:hypothetical protein